MAGPSTGSMPWLLLSQQTQWVISHFGLVSCSDQSSIISLSPKLRLTNSADGKRHPVALAAVTAVFTCGLVKNCLAKLDI